MKITNTKLQVKWGVSITKAIVTMYGPKKGCKGCEYALGQVGGRRNHTDHCRKRLIDLSNEFGNEKLKDMLDQEFEKITKRYIEHDEIDDILNKRSKREGEFTPIPEIPTQTGTKRSGCKAGVSQEPSKKYKSETPSSSAHKRAASKTVTSGDEPDTKRLNSNMQDGFSSLKNFEVYDFYSRPRVTPVFTKRNGVKGKSFDILSCSDDGLKWDFTKAEMRAKARKHVLQNKPLWIIGSPPCDQWSIMQNLNKHKVSDHERTKRSISARLRLQFCTELYQMQIDGNRYYLHEYPLTASPWQEPCMKRLTKRPGNFTTKIHMCAYDMKILDAHGITYVYKPTQFITNSPLMAAQLERQRDRSHTHARLGGAHTAQAAIYPNKLINGLCRGMEEQSRVDKHNVNIIARIEYIKGTNVLNGVQKAMANAAKCHEKDIDFGEYAVDDVSGEPLDPNEVRKACMDEVKYISDSNLYTKVPIKECVERTGKQPIAVKWIDRNEQDAKNPLYRSRLVGKEFNTCNDITLYAATPPLEALRLIISIDASNGYDIMTNDVSRVYFCAPVQEGQYIYVKLPEEDKAPGEEGMCGRLNYSMYGTRRAATNWQAHYTKVLVQNEFTVGLANCVTFHNQQKQIYCMVHGDDFITTGPKQSLD